MQENNGRTTGANPVNDNVRPDERNGFNGNPVPPERNGSNGAAPKAKKVGLTLTTMLASSLAVVAVVSGAGAASNKAQAALQEYWASDSAVYYQAYVEEGELTAVLKNAFTERTEPLEPGDNLGAFEDLRPNMEYTLTLQSGKGLTARTVDEIKIRTLSPEEMPQTKWRGIEHECTCDTDGNFHFKMDFIDENYYWYDFTATLTDADGNRAECLFTDDPLADQTILVTGYLFGTTATFTVGCTTVENGEPEQIVLYETTVQI